MKLLESTKNKIRKDENGENVPQLEITEVVYVHCNIVNNHYYLDSRVMCTSVPNKSFDQLIDISPKNLTFLKTFYSEFSYTEVWFIDRNSKPIEIVDKINITFIVISSVVYKKMYCFWISIKCLLFT